MMVMMTGLMMLIRDEAVKNPNPKIILGGLPGRIRNPKIIAKTTNFGLDLLPRRCTYIYIYVFIHM